MRSIWYFSNTLSWWSISLSYVQQQIHSSSKSVLSKIRSSARHDFIYLKCSQIQLANKVVKWIANCDCEKKFRNNTIQFFECWSQSQHNTIWFSIRSKLKRDASFRSSFCPNSSWFIQIKFRKKTQIAIRNFHNFRNLWNCGVRNFANNTIGFWAHFTTLAGRS